jgi:hypothetical protein
VKFERRVKEEMQARALREWQRIESLQREARLTINSGEVVVINSILSVEDEDVEEEIGERDKRNQQQRE